MPGGEAQAIDAVAARWARAGQPYRPMSVVHDHAYQSQRLRAADVDPALFGDSCEAGLFGLPCFSAMVTAGHEIDGYVFVGQAIRQLQPIRLGQAVTLTGHVRECRPVRNGICVIDAFRLSDADGRVCWESELTGLLVDEAARRAAAGAEAPLLKRDAIPGEGWRRIQEKTLTPQKVRDFSEDVGNLIHFDEGYAQRHGFRAPLAQGVMSTSWLLSVLYHNAAPEAFDVDIRYMRPVFWDAPASLWARADAQGRFVAVQSRDGDGKTTADLIVRYASYRNGSGQ